MTETGLLSAKAKEKLKNQLRFENYAPQRLRIRDKKQKIIPFQFNKAQLLINEIRDWVKERGYPERYEFLKARQKGISTYWEADIFHSASTTKQQKCAVIAHKLEASQNLYDMTQRYYKYLDPAYKPITQNTNEKKLKYLELESEIKVMTAGMDGEGTGRSDTLSRIHCSEVAFWNNAKETLLSLLQVVPDEPNTLVVLESTANGVGGEFYDRWQEVYINPNRIEIIPNIAWYSPDSGYVAIFISWLVDDEYTKPFETEEAKQRLLSNLDAKEKELITLGATPEHLNWRRFTIKNKAGGDVAKWTQEYPSTPEEAFIVSGRPVFDAQACYTNLLKAKQPFRVGDLVPAYDFLNRDYRRLIALGQTDYQSLSKYVKSVEFVDNPKGFVRLHYDFLIRDHEKYRFAAGSDIAEGLEQGDYTVCKVLDRKTNKVILTWYGHLATDLYAEELHKLQIFLGNDVYFAIERNNNGLAVIVKAFPLGVNLYYEEQFDKGFAENTEKIGFRTSDNRARSGSRTLMINDLASAIRDNEFIDDEKEFWNEALTFVYDAQGKAQAQGKHKDPNSRCYDDRIFASIGMWVCHLWMPNYKVLVPENTEIKAILKKIQQKNRLSGRSAMSS